MIRSFFNKIFNSSKTPKGISLHIGLDHVKRSAYGGSWDGKLNHCVDDAEAMKRIAVKNKFSSTKIITNENATRKNVIHQIQQASTEVDSGDLFLLTYSGHGSYVEDFTGNKKHKKDERDGKDETWCLYDGLLIDDEIHSLLKKFKSNVRVLVISDSCHSGTVVKSDEEIEGNFAQLPTRNLPKGVRDNLVETEKEKILTTQEVLLKDPFPPAASILLLAACQDKQKAYEGYEGYGIFTKQLLDVWNQGAFQGSYNDFFNTINLNMPKVQNPKMHKEGRINNAFYNQAPFSI